MDWFKDKQNRPIVIAIGVGLIVVIVAAIIFMKPKTEVAGGEAGIPGGAAGGAPGMPPGMGPGGGMPGGPPGMPGAPGAGPGSAGVMPGGAPGMPVAPAAGAPGGMSPAGPSDSLVVASNPMEPWRNDPFMPLGYKARVKPKNIRPKILDFPFMQVNKFPQKSETDIDETPQPARRMSGLLMNSRLYAIIETEGKSEIVRPGDMLKDGLATVESVERDRIILKTTGPRPRTIEIRLASAPKDQTGNLGGVPGGMPGGGMGPGGMPGGAPGMPPGMGPGGMPGGAPGMPPPPPGGGF